MLIILIYLKVRFAQNTGYERTDPVLLIWVILQISSVSFLKLEKGRRGTGKGS